MYKNFVVLGLGIALSGCSMEAARQIFGYIPPPEETTVGEELKLEYKRCLKIGAEKNCAQAAYDVVRKVKGLEPRKVPKGIVIILEGDDGRTSGEGPIKEDKEGK